jgi:hypothetical protein
VYANYFGQSFAASSMERRLLEKSYAREIVLPSGLLFQLPGV